MRLNGFSLGYTYGTPSRNTKHPTAPTNANLFGEVPYPSIEQTLNQPTPFGPSATINGYPNLL